MFTAFLDTCSLWPNLQRDFLLSMASENLYKPAWSSEIVGELADKELVKLVKRGVDKTTAEARVLHLIQQMTLTFSDAEVTGWKDLDRSFRLPDPGDEHVVRAAVVGGVDAIITDNLRDFPAQCLPGSLRVLTPKEFVARAVSWDAKAARAAVEVMARRSGVHGPRLTVGDILDILEHRYGMAEAADLIRQV